jgi:hypothetical protein
MPEFISKLQHYISEKGEFTGEKVRNLSQTIELINNFTWEEERPFDDFNITGPSVTIQDENFNYLKIRLYQDNMFNVYYLDNNNHLYECQVANLEATCVEVTNFFKGQIDLQQYNKHLFNIGNRINFLSKSFIYKANLWETVSSCLSVFVLLFFAILMLFELSPTAPFSNKLILISIIVLTGGMLAYIFVKYFSYLGKSIQISKGDDIFYFNDGLTTTQYDKNNIEQIIIYTTGSGTRKPLYFHVFEIHFNDGSLLKFSNMLISNANFRQKFPADIIVFSNKWAFFRL